jgi:hypothetical protein
MKIYPISLNQQQFRGLWGSERQKQVEVPYYSQGLECDLGTDHVIIEKDYYPFMDETQEEIDEIIKKYNKTERTVGGACDAVEYIRESIVNIRETIPLTAKRYRDYIERKLLSRSEMRVEDKLKRAGLQRFLR